MSLHVQRACRLYRHSLKAAVSWCVQRELFYAEVRPPPPPPPGEERVSAPGGHHEKHRDKKKKHLDPTAGRTRRPHSSPPTPPH